MLCIVIFSLLSFVCVSSDILIIRVVVMVVIGSYSHTLLFTMRPLHCVGRWVSRGNLLWNNYKWTSRLLCTVKDCKCVFVICFSNQTEANHHGCNNHLCSWFWLVTPTRMTHWRRYFFYQRIWKRMHAVFFIFNILMLKNILCLKQTTLSSHQITK